MNFCAYTAVNTRTATIAGHSTKHACVISLLCTPCVGDRGNSVSLDTRPINRDLVDPRYANYYSTWSAARIVLYRIVLCDRSCSNIDDRGRLRVKPQTSRPRDHRGCDVVGITVHGG